MVAVVMPRDSPARANQSQRRDELIILDTYVSTSWRVRHDLNRSIHCGTMNRTVVVNNLCVRKSKIERIAMSEPLALECNARATRKLMNKNRDLMICARRSRVSHDQATEQAQIDVSCSVVRVVVKSPGSHHVRRYVINVCPFLAGKNFIAAPAVSRRDTQWPRSV